jgi:hypothetical protein
MAEPVVEVLGEKVAAPPPPPGGGAAPVGDLGGGAPLRSLLREEGVGGTLGVTTEKLDKLIPTMRSLIKLMKLRNLKEVFIY